MKIKKHFKESNETTDISGDYVEIKIPMSTYQRMIAAIITARIRVDERKFKPLEDAFDEAFKNGEKVWY